MIQKVFVSGQYVFIHFKHIDVLFFSPVGDTDGVINGKKYFSANIRHGKLIKISDILAVLIPKVSQFCKTT